MRRSVLPLTAVGFVLASLLANAAQGEEKDTAKRAKAAAKATAASGALREDGGATRAELDRAVAARPSVVRVRWRDARYGDLATTRNAIVVRADGLLLMAGPPPSRRGTLTAVVSPGRTLRARIVASDPETALTLLKVPTSGLRPLPGAAPSVVARSAPAGLAQPTLGARVLMVTADGALAVGAVRAHGRQGSVVDPDRRTRLRTTALFGAALAAVDADAGAPLLDGKGALVGLLVGRRATIAPERGEQAARRGLHLRPTPVEAVAVAASVVRLVWPLLERHGRVPRAGLGLDTQPADAALRTHLGLEAGGHVIQRIDPKGPAASQGLRRHDVIVSLNGVRTPAGMSLSDVLLPLRPRTRVKLGVIRQGKPVQVELVLGERATR